jgi:hypothetical protein
MPHPRSHSSRQLYLRLLSYVRPHARSVLSFPGHYCIACVAALGWRARISLRAGIEMIYRHFHRESATGRVAA